MPTEIVPTFPDVICIGEALTDMLSTGTNADTKQWLSVNGGATWNVARAIAKLGQHCAFAGAVSNDLFGHALREASVAAGLDTRTLQVLDYSPLLAIVDNQQPPNYFFIGDDSADLHFDSANLPQGWNSNLRWAHFGGISLARQPLAKNLLELAQQLHQQGVAISYDPNFRNLMGPDYDAVLQQMTRLASVIKVSDDDLRGLFRSNDAEAGFAKLRAINPEAIYLYTRGSAGASLHIGEQSWQCAVPTIVTADTVGAGDASIAGMLYSLMQRTEASWPEHLRFAVACGAAACLQRGAHAGDLAQVMQLYQSLATN